MYIEELLKERQVLRIESHPETGKYCVILRDAGCVFVSSKHGEKALAECEQYIEENSHRYVGDRYARSASA